MRIYTNLLSMCCYLERFWVRIPQTDVRKNSHRCCTAVFSKEADVASVSGNIMFPTREYDKRTRGTERGYNFSPDVWFEDKKRNVKGGTFCALQSVKLLNSLQLSDCPEIDQKLNIVRCTVPSRASLTSASCVLEDFVTINNDVSTLSVNIILWIQKYLPFLVRFYQLHNLVQ